jgi:hypothetical protein
MDALYDTWLPGRGFLFALWGITLWCSKPTRRLETDLFIAAYYLMR